MTSPKMKQILRLFDSPATCTHGRITKATVVKTFGRWYYYNAEKYIGDILGRMVKNGLLVRTSPGVFKRDNVKTEDKNQMKLF